MRGNAFWVVGLAVVLSGCVGYLSIDEKGGSGGTQGSAEQDRESGSESPDEEAGGSCGLRPRKAGPMIVRRLTADEYIETVRQTLGVDIEGEARKQLPAEVQADGFRNTSYSLTVDIGHIQAYANLAYSVVQKMSVGSFVSDRISCSEMTESCFRTLISEVGTPILRSPPSKRQVQSYLEVFRAVRNKNGDFKEAASFVLRAMLQSPEFIYRIENQRGDQPLARVDGYELASRLSYFIWGGPPDAKLLEAAESGGLSDLQAINDQVERMLDDPRADKSLRRFIRDWLSLGRLSSLERSDKRFPDWNSELASDMRRETLTFAEHVLRDEQRPVSDLFNAQTTFATPELAAHYGLESEGSGLSKYDLTDVPERGGLLTQGSVLTIGGEEASTVSRGLFVLRDVLCGDVGSPPPDLDTSPVPPEPGKSQREIAEGRIANSSCGGCHSKFEPLSFGLGKFNGVGAHVDVDEHGNKLRDDGALTFPGSDKKHEYDNSAEMMEILAGSERVDRCMTRKLTQFAVGRKLTETDRCVLRKVRKKFEKGGETYASLVTAIATSELVTMKQTQGGTR